MQNKDQSIESQNKSPINLESNNKPIVFTKVKLSLLMIVCVLIGVILGYYGSRNLERPQSYVKSIVSNSNQQEASESTISNNNQPESSEEKIKTENENPTLEALLIIPKKYLLKKSDDLELTIPVKNLNHAIYQKENDLNNTININDNIFNISIVGSRGFYCPTSNAVDGTDETLIKEQGKCRTTTDSLPNSSGITTWIDGNETVYALTINDLVIQTYYTDVIIVTKTGEERFSNAEILMWKDVLSNISIRESNL